MFDDLMETGLNRVLSGLTISEQPNYQVAKLMGDVKWQGQMSALSKEHMSWGIIYEAAQASEKSAVTSAAITRSLPLPDSIITSAEYEPVTVRQVVLVSFASSLHTIPIAPQGA